MNILAINSFGVDKNSWSKLQGVLTVFNAFFLLNLIFDGANFGIGINIKCDLFALDINSNVNVRVIHCEFWLRMNTFVKDSLLIVKYLAVQF